VTKSKNIVSKIKKAKKECHMEVHPDHSKEGVRLKRVKGQLEGILKMIEEKRYCPDILIQVRAAKSAIQAIEHSILKTHLASCVREALHENNEEKVNLKIEELIVLIERHK
jgi:DNA-binding FrmR family transcriptional regulator